MAIIDEEVEDFLEHFGIRGMRWGHRRITSDQLNNSPKKNHTKRNIAIAAGTIAIGSAAAFAIIKHKGKIKAVKIIKERKRQETIQDKISREIVFKILSKQKLHLLTPPQKKALPWPIKPPTEEHKKQAAALIEKWSKTI